MANEPYANSQRVVVINELITRLKKVNTQRYYVRRGPINWSTFNFDEHLYAMSVICDETSFLRQGPQTMVMSVEVMTKMKNESDLGKTQIEDTGIDELIRDVQTCVAELETAMQQGMFNGEQDNVIFRLDHETDKIVEISDTMQGMQGIWATFIIDY